MTSPAMPSMRQVKRVSVVLIDPRRGVPSCASVAAEPPRQLDVELVEVDVADALEELGGPGVGEGLGQLVAPGLVFGLQGAELAAGGGQPLRPRQAVLGAHDGADGLAGGGALAVSAAPPPETATPALGGVAQDSHWRFAGSRVPAQRISCAVARDSGTLPGCVCGSVSLAPA